MKSVTSPGAHPAIDEQVDAGDVRAFVGREEERGVRDVFWSTEPAEHRPAQHVTGPFSVFHLLARLLSLDNPGRDGVGSDPMLATLHRKMARHRDDTGFG